MKAKEIHVGFQNLVGKAYMMICIVNSQKVLLPQNSLQKCMQGRQLKVQEIAEAVGMSSECIYHILTEELGMKKLSARWVKALEIRL